MCVWCSWTTGVKKKNNLPSDNMKTRAPKPKSQALKATTWIPDELRLPDDVASIEAGRQPRLRQQVLFDDSIMARLRAIKSGEDQR